MGFEEFYPLIIVASLLTVLVVAASTLLPQIVCGRDMYCGVYIRFIVDV